MTKNTVRNANNAVVIEDIFDVFSRHVDQMSSYRALPVAMRDEDRDKTYGEKWKDTFVSSFMDNINPLGLIPIAKDAYNAIKGETPTLTDVQGFQDIAYAVSKIQKLIEGENTYTPQYTAVYTAKMLSKLTGSPINNILREDRRHYKYSDAVRSEGAAG